MRGIVKGALMRDFFVTSPQGGRKRKIAIRSTRIRGTQNLHLYIHNKKVPIL